MKLKTIESQYDFRDAGIRLKDLRTSVDATRKELTKASNLKLSTVENIEFGKSRMSIEHLIVFCEVFKMTPSEFLKGMYKEFDSDGNEIVPPPVESEVAKYLRENYGINACKSD